MRATLLEMLTYCRPMGSPAERKFRNRYLANLPNATTDAHGNIHVAVGDGSSTVLWSAHTDTVHRASGRQRLVMVDNVVGIASGSRSSCLGADDTAGVYILREMILRGVPGYYIFHYGEERGGIGSRALADARSVWLSRFTCAIALDRQGTGDVITHQGGRTASEAFARELGRRIGEVDPQLVYTPAEGIYTDTAEYAEVIPECTNLSVGYQHAHSPGETLNLAHVERLLAVLCQLDLTTLLPTRDPQVHEYSAGGYLLPGYDWDRWDLLEDGLDVNGDVLNTADAEEAYVQYLREMDLDEDDYRHLTLDPYRTARAGRVIDMEGGDWGRRPHVVKAKGTGAGGVAPDTSASHSRKVKIGRELDAMIARLGTGRRRKWDL